MKKYMIAAATLLLFAGMANAQVAKKPASAVKPASYTKSNSVSTKNTGAVGSVTPTAKKTTPSPAIKRKHHHKKAKATTTTGKN